ncbi:la-related protein 6A [Carya illinoinensis]|nr:la-related protein 6A [Carya illinoinensis]XP_042941514.1 la-related protein 6A [Carya illinoinensis]XP_042941515.1 la-related protein 6A [Carya illinoinensis]XP_042941516.1 la-related protein 6A [Carya illinoinensis]
MGTRVELTTRGSWEKKGRATEFSISYSQIAFALSPSSPSPMEGREGPTSPSHSHSDPPSPPRDLDPDFTPVGSPDHDLHIPEIHALPSDEDHDHDHGKAPDHPGGAAVLTDDLKHKIIKQVEYYFSDENLSTDKYMLGFIKKNKEGFVPMAVIGSFRKMKKLTRDYSLIATALRESSFLVVSSNGKKVKRLHPLPSTEVRDPKLFTVLVENLPEDHSVENIQRIFGEAGSIKNICIRDPHAVEELTKVSKPEMLISSKLHVLVEYETVEAAEKAVATLNDEMDWRNGMRVKLLKRVVKYGQRKNAWRGSDSEKNSTSRGSDHTGDEENHNLSEHHDDTPDEEDGEHLLKEKIGQRGHNRGRSRRHNYRGINGLGHGSTSSTHAIEASKPPPGPRMPDGTRGFTLGRGRPPISNQS